MSILSVEILSDHGIETKDSLSFMECPTVAKVMRAATVVIGVALPIGGLISGDPALFALSLIGSALAFASKSLIHDYDDPVELQKMRVAAKELDWYGLTQMHSLIRLSQLLSPSEIVTKFQTCYENCDFSKILSEYPLSTIHQYRLADLSEESFLKTSFLKEMQIDPVKTLRKWTQNNWGLEHFPYRMMLPARQMEGLIIARRNLEVADNTHSRVLESLSKRYSYRTERWLLELALKELEIPAKVHALGVDVEDSVKKAYDVEIRNALSFNEMYEITEERNRVARDARVDAELRERNRLEAEIFAERLDPFRNALAIEQQDLYDRCVQTANSEHAISEILIMNTVFSILQEK